MKKTLGTLVCAATLLCGAAQAKAELLTDWTYNLSSVSLTNVNTEFATSAAGNASFTSGGYTINLSPENVTDPGNAVTGSLVFTGDGTSASSAHDDKLLNQTTANANTTETPATKVADLNFSYSVASDSNPGVSMTVTYTIPLYTFYSSDVDTTYVYYNNSEVSTSGSTAITHDGYKYGITGVGLFVDGRALENFPGGENDPNLYSGWAINEDTFNNNYSKYVVGGDNSATYLGSKSELDEFGNEIGLGSYSITGVFSIANSKVETPPNPTPEPATMLLMGLGLAGLGFVARRRNK